MARSKLDRAVDFLKQRGWEFRPAEKIQGVFKPVGKYDAKNPAQDDFGIYDNKTLRNYSGSFVSKSIAISSYFDRSLNSSGGVHSTCGLNKGFCIIYNLVQ